MSKQMMCSVRVVRDGLGADEVWQCKCRRPEESPDSGGGTAAAPQGQVVCRECGEPFSRQGDLKRHKCLLESSRPVEEQRGSVQCTLCHRWFRSTGVHRRRLQCTKELKLVPSIGRTCDP